MHIYFSGIGGVGIGPLAEMAVDAGYTVSGSDGTSSPMLEQLAQRGISAIIGQDGSQIAALHAEKPVDWFVYTSALPDDHPELAFARANGIRASKRDELISEIIKERSLKLIAVAGTHGKTTTTGMLVWVLTQLSIPISYSVGTTLGFGPSGKYHPDSKYFIYECDEFDRNFLHFYPEFSLIPSIDYDHHHTFASRADYEAAFAQFIKQSGDVYLWQSDANKVSDALDDSVRVLDKAKESEKISAIKLAGQHVRENAYLVQACLGSLFDIEPETLQSHLSNFPGTDRRFEKLADNLYTDYGHHPTEIAATLQMARELSDNVVLVYQPHQNSRQYEVKQDYAESMKLAKKVYWLPTYLSREDDNQPVLSPEELTSYVQEPKDIAVADMNDELWDNIQTELHSGAFVLLMGAGTIDAWAREQLKT